LLSVTLSFNYAYIVRELIEPCQVYAAIVFVRSKRMPLRATRAVARADQGD
jgi:hypothetical protein